MKSDITLSLAALLAVFAASPLPAIASDCAPAHTVKTISPGDSCLHLQGRRPFISASGDGGIKRTDADILKKIAAKECLTVVPVTVDPAAAIQYVISGKADIAAGDWYRSVARSKAWAFPNRPTSIRWESTQKLAPRRWNH